MAVAEVTDEPQYGGYEYEFVDKVPERYLCSIVCHKVLRDARLLVCCGKYICESCLNRWLRSQGKLRQPLCPHCRRKNFVHVDNLAIRREINELKIRCTNGKAGCTWMGALSNLKTHLESEKGCGYVEVHCTNKCKKQLKRKDLADHLTQHCPLREYKCQHCGKEDIFQTITEEHYDECPSYPLDCPNTCGAKGIKRVMIRWHRNECPLEPVECPNNVWITFYVQCHVTGRLGAKCKQQLLQKDLADHLAQHCPLRKYKCQHCGQEDTYQTITEEHYDECPNYPLDCPNECGGRGIKRAEMSQHRSECPLEPVECPFKEAGCQVKLVRRELDSHVTTNQQHHLLTLMAAFREVKTSSKAELRQVKTELRQVKTELRQVKAEFSTAKEATKVMQEVIATDVTIIQQNNEKQLSVQELPFMYDRQSSSSSALALASIKSQLEINSFRLQCDGPPLIIRMINFSHYQQSGKVWYSPPFYCHPGYKMQLAVYANGTGAGAWTHVSIALLLMKGELDHQIPWPVTQEEFRVRYKVLVGMYRCCLCLAFPIHRVLEKEGVRELRRREEFVDQQTVSKRLLNDSIVLKIEMYDTMYFLITLL